MRFLILPLNYNEFYLQLTIFVFQGFLGLVQTLNFSSAEPMLITY